MEGKKVEQYYTPPPKLGKWEGFRVFVWNSETGQFLGRTGASWGKLSLWKYVFYTSERYFTFITLRTRIDSFRSLLLYDIGYYKIENGKCVYGIENDLFGDILWKRIEYPIDI